MQGDTAQGRRFPSQMAEPGDELLDRRAGLGWSGPENGHGARCRPPVGDRVDGIRERISIAEPADEVDRAGITAFRETTSLEPARQLIFVVRPNSAKEGAGTWPAPVGPERWSVGR